MEDKYVTRMETRRTVGTKVGITYAFPSGTFVP
jgi:hypothetical protein